MLLLFSLSVAVLCGVVLVARGGSENSLIGLNVATICGVTMLVVLQEYFNIAFSRDIAFYLIFPGVFGVIVVCMLLRNIGGEAGDS
jgi:multisubunit Na+/H+ antiporter MnhF subunit